jgi:hypothetical protein
VTVVVVPLVEDFLLRFPEFKGMDEQKIALSLYDASTYVSEDWIEVHVTQAVMALAAHFLWLEGTRSDELAAALSYGSSGGTTVTKTGPVTMKSVGPLSVKYQGSSESTSTGGGSSGGGAGLEVDLESSVYGQRFLILVRYSFPPVLAVI